MTEDIERTKFNTAVSKLMVFVNEVYDKKAITKEQLSMFLQILAPFATRLTQKMREALGNNGNIHLSIWPKCDSSKIADDVINLPVQINGKTKGAIDVNAGVSQDEVMEMIRSDEKLNGNIA
ncbi:class I tRNA ligase family protein [Patescibacteria group bacterium]|nr:class I tRNA ligase family protein [Patescibacteria group bacterium]